MKKTKTFKRILSLLMALMLVAALMASALVPASAMENQKAKEAARSVLQLVWVYTPGGNLPAAEWSRATCFVIDSGYLLTAAHCVEVTRDDLDAVEEFYRSNFNSTITADKKNFSFKAYLDSGISRKVTVEQASINDFAYLKPDKALTRPALPLGDSDVVERTDTIYVLGYPGGAKLEEESITHTDEKLSISEGSVTNLPKRDGYSTVQFDASIQGGNSGGPILNANGEVIAITTAGWADGEFKQGIAINEVIPALEDDGVPFVRSDDPPPTEETTVADETDTESVTETITETVSQTDTETTDEKKDDNTKLIIIIVIAVLAVVIVAVVIVIILSSKKKGNGNNNPPTPPTPPTRPGSYGGNQQMPTPGPRGPANRPVYPSAGGDSATYMNNDGVGETSVLNDGAGETTVLGGAGGAQCVLLRKRNNEKINIGKSEFVIGKERRKVDYCISDNNSVSRAHAKLSVRGGRCYVTDLNSTNCTYVNGNKVSPNQEVILSRGDTLKIADEEFEFMG